MKVLHYLLLLIVTVIIGVTEGNAQIKKTNADKIDGPVKPVENKGNNQVPSTNDQKKNEMPNLRDGRDTTLRKKTLYNENMDTPTTNYTAPGGHTNTNSNYGLIGLFVETGVSDGEFKTVSNGDIGVGFGLTGLYNFLGNNLTSKSPIGLYLGGSFDYLYFGGKSDYIYHDDPYDYYLRDKVTTAVNQNAYTLQVVSKITFFNGPIVPFIEGCAGGRWFDGVNKVTVDVDLKPGYSKANFKPISSTDRVSVASSVVGTYGYGGGFMFGSSNVKFEVKLMYVKGTTASYLDQNSIDINPVNNVVQFQTKSSTTDMFIAQLGLSFIF